MGEYHVCVSRKKVVVHYFKWIHTLFTGFIWSYKHPKFRRSLLTLPKQYGGLVVPDLYKHYQATLLSHLIDWRRHGDLKICPSLEQAQGNVLLHVPSWCFRALSPSIKAHPLIGPTLSLCSGLFSKDKLSSMEPPLFPILGIPQFSPGFEEGGH